MSSLMDDFQENLYHMLLSSYDTFPHQLHVYVLNIFCQNNVAN